VMSNTILNHIRNSQVKHHDQVSKELGTLSKFYTPENGGAHQRAYGSGGLPWPYLAVVSARGAKLQQD